MVGGESLNAGLSVARSSFSACTLLAAHPAPSPRRSRRPPKRRSRLPHDRIRNAPPRGRARPAPARKAATARCPQPPAPRRFRAHAQRNAAPPLLAAPARLHPRSRRSSPVPRLRHRSGGRTFRRFFRGLSPFFSPPTAVFSRSNTVISPFSPFFGGRRFSRSPPTTKCPMQLTARRFLFADCQSPIADAQKLITDDRLLMTDCSPLCDLCVSA